PALQAGCRRFEPVIAHIVICYEKAGNNNFRLFIFTWIVLYLFYYTLYDYMSPESILNEEIIE
ncbi:MAG: hypothetical protein KAQ69_10400, partial [Spirochaetales bacterium]|nr:hypothetical protein [Spirochaetales bacterium]